jgi:NTE family protein
LLDRPRRSDPAVTNGSERLPSPLLIGFVERILQHTRDRVIVFGDHEDETVILCERFLPAQCLGVLAGRRDFNLNPLRDLLSRIVDWDIINRGGDIPLFLTATSVRNGRSRVFRCSQITIDVLMASACIPFYSQSVEIDGEAYWDGGYMGNPSIWPLIYHTDSKDVLLVQINPLNRDPVPKKIDEIINRLNELVFNSGLIAEMRAINFVRKLIEDGDLSEEKYKRMNMHMIPAPDMACHLNPSSKLNTNILFFETMRDIGRKAADTWIRQNKRYIGEKSTIDIEAVFLGGPSDSEQEQEQRKLVKTS